MSAPSLLLTDQLAACDRIRQWAAANAPGVLGEALIREVEAIERMGGEWEAGLDSLAQFLMQTEDDEGV